MKRSRLIPELTDPPRRRRTLSDEERALWETVAKQTRPLPRKPRATEVAREAEMSAATNAGHAEPPSSKMLRVAKVAAPPSPPPLSPLGRRERSQLSRGRKEIEARLDLHGMTQKRAHRVLQDFLRRAHAEGLTFVLVITGKGKTAGAESGRGVLRRQVPRWLALPEFRTMVVGFEEAHIGHGGEGALYVRIRRMRI
ncbi:MAG: Smr/MutS family protein [Bradyrhizobium sp.]|uniref:Smr/MutS family protein n=1 Tax=Bradyrhizobium sp. TaxID=376 RepID=UPI0023958DD2|nr:Smr/MutS family protein [Bradyrhizobium sp.]MDE2603707.1 Smr/MutS family protein [Bradyrhizobium sp.]